jgi:signal transduction histidine kinase
MQHLDTSERLYLERQVTLARAIFVALSLVALLETSSGPMRRASVVFLWIYVVYFFVALAAALSERFFNESPLRLPLPLDFLILAVFLYLTPSVTAVWFLFLFAVFALATRGSTRAMLVLVTLAPAGVIARLALEYPFRWQSVWHWIAIGLGTLVSGLGMGFLGTREREYLGRQQFLKRITSLLQFNRGLSESIRQALGELALTFDCEQACLASHDDELERLFIWRVNPNGHETRGPETVPVNQADAFLMDSLETSMCWEFKNGGGEGFGWDRRTGRFFRNVPPPPASTREELGAKSLLAVTIEASDHPVGRVILLNPKRRFTVGDLRWFEQIVRHIGPPLENVFLLRSLRARAIESERSRISRDLHDGILQTLLSLNIQLGVLKNKVTLKPEQAGADLTSLQKTVQEEGEELRRMVTDLRPLRVDSADMRELMHGFAERFRNESGLKLDLFIEDQNMRVPDRLCRELFQIYREALHNIKKHAKASHVVVKLGQDDARVSLVIDDNGTGFSFSGHYASEELDRLRLGPISIKERTRSVGGTLTVESNPGHGARLTIEIPLN